MARHDLTDAEYNQIRDLFCEPQPGQRGRPPRPARLMLNAILWILATGSAWRDLPEEFGSWKTAYHWFRLWSRTQLWDTICERLHLQLDQEGKLDRTLWCVDGTTVRAHRCCAGAADPNPQTQPEEPQDHALGRSRGGYSTKIHLVTDSEGVPLAVKVTAGQRHESTQMIDLLNAVSLVDLENSPLVDRPDAVAGDKGYSYPHLRQWLNERKIEDVIPSKSNQPKDEGFDREKYRGRNIAERVIGWLKENRRVFSRFEKTATHYRAMIQIAIMRRMMKL